MRTLLPLKVKLEAVTDNPGCFELEPDFVIFNGNCEQCRPHCESACCQIYDYVELTDEEGKSGRYKFIEEDPNCNCDTCRAMRILEIHYSLAKNPDYSCIYLDERKMCGIYETRPQTCRTYNCKDKILPFVTEA